MKAIFKNIEIEFETMGTKSDPAYLCIMGQGGSMKRWRRGFLERLTSQGYYIIIYDNRDTGLSTKFTGSPDILQLAQDKAQGKVIEVPYSLEDMAHDAMELMSYLGIENYHVMGISMGAMIAQVLSYTDPRVLSLTSIMSGTGNTSLPLPREDVLELMSRPPPNNVEEYIEHNVDLLRRIYGTYPFDEEETRKQLQEAEQESSSEAFMRHYAAIVKTGDRAEKLKDMNKPTLIIHGVEDSLVRLAHAEHMKQVMPHAKLVIYPKMGHSMPPELWDDFCLKIRNITTKAVSL